jgi:hypothetical protein
MLVQPLERGVEVIVVGVRQVRCIRATFMATRLPENLHQWVNPVAGRDLSSMAAAGS